MTTCYISFCGFFDVPDINFDTQFPKIPEESARGFRKGLKYEQHEVRDSLTVYLAEIDEQFGHLVADCPNGNWVDSCFVFLDKNGNPIKSDKNFNPNPVPQLLD